jgi:hypothetical protein
MTARPLLAQHCNGACDRAGEAQQNMKAYDEQKGWIGGWYLDSR